jgi:hypothetical protein
VVVFIRIERKVIERERERESKIEVVSVAGELMHNTVINPLKFYSFEM